MVSPVEIALLALLGLLWGMPYALTKIALTTISPVTLVAARVALAQAMREEAHAVDLSCGARARVKRLGETHTSVGGDTIAEHGERLGRTQHAGE